MRSISRQPYPPLPTQDFAEAGLEAARPRTSLQMRYPHEPDHPFYELDWVFLHERPEILRRLWELAWREGRV